MIYNILGYRFDVEKIKSIELCFEGMYTDNAMMYKYGPRFMDVFLKNGGKISAKARHKEFFESEEKIMNAIKHVFPVDIIDDSYKEEIAKENGILKNENKEMRKIIESMAANGLSLPDEADKYSGGLSL